MLLNMGFLLQHIAPTFRFSLPRSARGWLLPCLAVLFLAGCAVQDPDAVVTRDGISDPYEAHNRRVHAFNKGVDRAVLRPLSRGYTRAVPEDIRLLADNFAANLSAPGLVVNNLLQGNVKGALANTYRFAINSTIGFAGLVDVGDITGVAEVDTDFGETLHVWGAKEGNFVELPFRGPSTQRDAVGHVVDLFTNPLSTVLSGTENEIRIGAQVVDVIADRGRFGDTVDSILYDSADSYAQSRLIYLQNRRFTLNRSGGAAYDDPYSAAAIDPYDDPYEDPYED